MLRIVISCLLHLPDPVKALKEMSRVCKGGGMMAVGEADLDNMIMFPGDSGLLSWIKLLGDLVRGGGSEPRAGRRLKAWALEAGFVRERL